ncbi:M10 family metallopeptidase C-terminal domain-containing protein [Tateyamaria omphalii]|uniref:calcium-binding protein n=1 Tax=Tateyamaria omphalii TaxID=299262 RepID=UPI001C993524|nr:calcium-binding protein [Tateyamaria omphalii]MBY5935543.1 M10 family metallopeptidase C-terminal domain-containing protein [Tateyamaria omphalii]
MAAEFIITDQTSTYSIDSTDEVFLTTGTEIRTSDAFTFSANVDGSINGIYGLYLAGDIFAGDDVFSQTFTATETSTDTVDLFVSVAETSTILAAGDGFVAAALDADLSDTAFTFANAGHITTGEAAIFADEFDTMIITNSGTITGLGTTTQALLDDLSGTVTVLNTGLIEYLNTSTANGVFFSDAVLLDVTNTGTIAASNGIAFETFVGSHVFNLNNSGTIRGDIDSDNATTIQNTYLIEGDVILGGADDAVSNTGMIIGDVNLSSGDDVFDGRGGTVTGTVDGGSNDDTYIIDDATIDIVDGSGTDTVQSEVSYTLALNIEALELLGAEDINGAGNGLDNTITGNDGANLIQGRFGDDTITGGGGDDTIGGGADVDSIDAGEGDDYANGGAGADTVNGDAGNDTLRGGLNNDVVTGGDGDDNIAGGLGNDTMTGNDGDDVLFGQGGNDVFNGGEGEDYIHGGAGVDALTGANGDDTLVGGAGADTLTGGNGEDVFLFQNFAQSRVGDVDTITDFEIGTDLIDLTALVPGQIAFGGTGAASANGAAELIIREPGGGPDSVVFVDVNGDGTQDFRLELTGVTGLSETDFLL